MDSSFYYVSKIFNHNFILEKYAQGDTEFFFYNLPRTNPWKLSDPDGWPSESFRRDFCDYKLQLFKLWVPLSFLVCPVSWRRSTAPPESHEGQWEGNQQRLWSHIQYRNHLLPLGESLSPRVTQLCTTVPWVTQWQKLEGELSTNSEQQWALAAECLWSPLLPAEFMVVCLSVSGWYKNHTNVSSMRTRSKHFPCVSAQSLQSCPTLWDPMDCSPPGSSVYGILQARILEWIAMPSSRGSSWPKDWTWVCCIAGGFFTTASLGNVPFTQLLIAAASTSLQLCPTLCDPIEGSPPGPPVPGILQARTRVGCRFLLQCMKGKSESQVAQSCPTLATPWTSAYQAPLSMGFSRQEYWSGRYQLKWKMTKHMNFLD